MTLLDKARRACRLTTEAFDDELLDLIDAARADLGVVGIVDTDRADSLIDRAVVTYVKLHHCVLQADEYDRLHASYNEQKGQLKHATGYTDWGR